MRKTIGMAMAAALLLAAELLAGGFFLQLGNPEANPQARKLNAALVVKATGCHDPAGARLTATAVGTVNGERREIPLKVDKLSEPGTFAITQQWPSEGKWVIELVAKNPDQFTNTLVVAGPQGVERTKAKFNMQPFTAADVDAMLK
ncbi:MAG TPA: hypothetical protein VGS58_05375 [Candidatus Sulfopaludibacter sp.]|nr:hypothetical protein [Candidatus Sulfopaludibacter sp.]